MDSKTVFNTVAKQANTPEKRLQVDLNAILESYSNNELANISYISGLMNPVDPLTKIGNLKDSPLAYLMTTKKISLNAIGWATVTNNK